METSRTLEITNVGEEVTVEEVFDFFMPRALRIEGLKKTSANTYQLRLFDREALEDCERLDGEYFRGKRIRVQPVSDSQGVFPHPFKPEIGKKSTSSVTLFVGNIPDSATEADMRKLFDRIGVTPVTVTMRRGGGGRAAHFAHVRFGTSDECIKASTLAGVLFRGNRLRIDWAAEKPVATAAVGAGNIGVGTAEEFRGKTSRVFIGNLTEDMTDAEVLPLFQNFGRISAFRNFKDKHGARYAYLSFEDAKTAETAVDELRNSGVAIRGQALRVDFARQDRGVPEDKRARTPSPTRATRVTFDVPAEYAEPPWDVFYP